MSIAVHSCTPSHFAPHRRKMASNRTIVPGRLALHAEASWNEYPFPTVENEPHFAPDPGGVVIDSSTPPSPSEGIDAIPDGSRVFQARIPITDEPSQLSIIMAAPGQVMVAIDGVVVTDDNEGFNAESTPEGEVAWLNSEPGLRDGFVTSFGLLSGRSDFIDASYLERLGIDTSEGEVDVTVFPQGFVDDSSWRVTYAPAVTVQGDAAPDAELSRTESTELPEFVYGHRRVASFEVRPTACHIRFL